MGLITRSGDVEQRLRDVFRPCEMGLLLRRLLLQHMHCEMRIGVGMYCDRYPTGAPGKGAERLECELVAVFGVDRLAGTEVVGFSDNVYLLTLAARQIDFDATAFAVVARVVLERRQIK